MQSCGVFAGNLVPCRFLGIYSFFITQGSYVIRLYGLQRRTQTILLENSDKNLGAFVTTSAVLGYIILYVYAAL